tara:strand:- start:409 stop:687 length:279 start_codon:yes stop_codon:yes gene_type:complete
MYLIFGGTCYYASGGANDLIETHDDKSCAIQRAIELIGLSAVTYKAKKEDLDWDNDVSHEIEWTQVYSAESGEVVHRSDNTPYADKQILEVK